MNINKACRIDQIASMDLLEVLAASNLHPSVAASLMAEEVDSQEEADARIREVLSADCYDVQLLDGGSEVGSTKIEADSMEEAIVKATEWAAEGDWDHAGAVKLVVSKGDERESVEIFVGQE